MRDFKKDSSSNLSRFARDKRERTSGRSSSEERRPRSQRDAADSGNPNERRSFNPNFSRENRPNFSSSTSGERRDGGERRERFERNAGGGERNFENRSGGDYKQSERGPRKFDQSSRGERGSQRFNSSPRGDKFERSNRSGERFERPNRGEGSDRPNRGGEGFGRSNRGDRFDKPQRREGDSARPYNNRERSFDKDGGYGARKKSYGASGNSYSSKRFDKRSDDGKNYPKYNPNKQTGEMRLNRYIAQSGLCSRREADEFITAGLVSINGVVVTELGTKVLPTDEVKFNDSKLQGEKKVYLVLNKPKGYVTSNDDPHADKLVMELVREACSERVYPVGRLDKNSVGLLLFTNDGDLTKQLTHPSHQKKKIYQVTLDKPLTRADMDSIANGIKLEDGDIFADAITYIEDDKYEIGIEIHSGRNRIVRRIFEHLGYTVKKLDRVYYAGLTKKNLKRGQWRFLTKEEVERLKSGRYE